MSTAHDSDPKHPHHAEMSRPKLTAVPGWDGAGRVPADEGRDMVAARTELADLIATAAGGLSDRECAVLELNYRHGLDGPELAQALGVSQTKAQTMTQRLRATIERSLGALLVARRARSRPTGCTELAEILDGWDGEFTILMRKRVARHIESCATCDRQRRRLINPVTLLGRPPVFIPAPTWLRANTLRKAALTCADTAPNSKAPPSERARRRLRVVGLVAATIVGSIGLTSSAPRQLPHQHSTAIAPTPTTAPVSPRPVR